MTADLRDRTLIDVCVMNVGLRNNLAVKASADF